MGSTLDANDRAESTLKSPHRARWAAIGAAIAVSIGAGGGYGLSQAVGPDGPKPVYVSLVQPCRLIDSRPATQVGPFTTPIGANETRTMDVRGGQGDCDIPTEALTLSINITAIAATSVSFFTLWPAGAPMPTASNLNLAPGQPPTPNTANVGLSTDGRFNVFNAAGTAHMIIDVAGYYADHEHDDTSVKSIAASNSTDAQLFLNDDASVSSVLSVTIATPTSGTVIVNSAATTLAQIGGVSTRCSINNVAGEHSAAHEQRWESAADEGRYGQLAGTRSFAVAGAGQATYHLNCQQVGLLVGSSIEDRSLTAIFIPS